MKKLLTSFVVFLISACATIGVPPPKTFNERVAVAISTVTTVRTLASNLLQAKKITVADAVHIQEQANDARTAIELARQIHATRPTDAEDKLSTILATLETLQTFLQSKQ